MIRCVIVTGLQYEGETLDEMEEREQRMREHNARLDEMIRVNSLPMQCMRKWAEDRQIIKR